MAADVWTISKPLSKSDGGVPVCPTVVSASAEPTGNAANISPTNSNTPRTHAKTTTPITPLCRSDATTGAVAMCIPVAAFEAERTPCTHSQPKAYGGGSADALSQLCQRHGVGACREAKLPGLIVRRAP